jgi:hypothetical protein
MSHLDETDVTIRHISILCLSVLFERLQGASNQEAIYQIYPKLLKCLDDSHDEIRLAICLTLQLFLRSGLKQDYSMTCLDYILDQLFIHLDDQDQDILSSSSSTSSK